MDFEEMQVIWDSQKERPMYALDLNALHASVKRKGRRIAWNVNAFELGLTAISVVTATILAAEPILEGTDLHKLFGAGLMLAVAAYVLVGRVRRRARERDTGSSLVGDLEHAISQVDYLIARVRTFQWWFILPAFLFIALKFALAYDTKPAWVWLSFLLIMALGYSMARLELRCLHLPKKRDLEALRAKLTDDA